jgi:hypothetical protein
MNCSKLSTIQCAFRLASQFPIRYTRSTLSLLVNTTTNLTRRPQGTLLFHTYHARYLIHHHLLTRSKLTFLLHAHNHSRRQITTWEDYTDIDRTEVDTMAGSASVTSRASSGKRKRSSPKFYAVKVGRKPGIYLSWEDCKAQTDGTKATCEFFI